MNIPRYIQYGCGWHAPPTWLNFDASPTLRFERIPVLGRIYTKNAQRFPDNVLYGDIVRGLPVGNESCKGVYCSHVLEHLALKDFRAALRNTRQMLMEGGVFRMVLPDLEANIATYVGNTSADACSEFLRATMLGRTERATGLRGLVVGVLGNSEHQWMWDYKGLAHELSQVGFRDVRRANYGDSNDPSFQEVEQPDRWEGCLGIECRK